MGCGSSKVGAVPDGLGMGAEPKYRGIKQTQDREVTILWDTDDTGCPPDNYTSLLFLNALHKVFVQSNKRKEPRVVLVYDIDRPLNTSPEAVALRSYLQTESVELLSSQGTTQQTLEDEIRKIVATAHEKSTIVLISSPVAYQDACACARQRNIFVERLVSTAGALSVVEESNADWVCSLKEFLKAHGIADWRLQNRDPSTSVQAPTPAGLLVDGSSQEPRSIEPQDMVETTDAASRAVHFTSTADNGDAVTSLVESPPVESPPVEAPPVESTESQAVLEPEAAPVVEVSPVTEVITTDAADADENLAASEDVDQCAHPRESELHQAPSLGEDSPEEGASPDKSDGQESGLPNNAALAEDPIVPEHSVAQKQDVEFDTALPPNEAELDTALPPKEAELDTALPPNEAGAPDENEPSVEVPEQEKVSPIQPSETEAPQESAKDETCTPPAPGHAADMDGEETCDSSIGHAVDTMLADVQTGLMEEFGSSDGSSWGGHEQDTAKSPEAEDAPNSKKASAKGSGSVAFAEPHTHACEDAIDAAVGALEGAESDDAPTGHGGARDRSTVKSRLGLSMRRGYVRAPSAVNDRDLEMDIEPMDAHVAAADGAEEMDVPAAKALMSDTPEVVPMIGPDPTMAWKADIMRTLRAAGDKAVKVETLLGMVPHPDCAAGGEYRAQLEEHLIERKLAVWVEDGYALQLA